MIDIQSLNREATRRLLAADAQALARPPRDLSEFLAPDQFDGMAVLPDEVTRSILAAIDAAHQTKRFAP